jgi:BlaI family transcriptional regulator, penicillinase repressor
MSGHEALPPLSEAQMEIMNVVWDRGEVTVADVWKALSARRNLARSTVLTMVTRLLEKGWLCCDEEGHAFRYRAAVPREATLGMVVRRLVDTAFGGSAEGLFLALLHDRGISKEEARRIKKMIDRAEGKKS